MKDIYSKNIKIIEKKYPILYKKIEKHEKKIDIQILTSRDNNKYMKIIVKDKMFNINSKYRPIDEAFRWIQALDMKNNSKIILFGLGLGYRPKYIFKKMTRDNFLLVIEPSIDIFIGIIKNIDLTNILSSDNVRLLVDENELVIKKSIKKLTGWYNIKQVVVSFIPNYNNIFKKEFDKYMNFLREEIEDGLIEYNTGQKLTKAWFNNFVSNIPHMLRSCEVQDLSNKFQNKPAIIVSAGPSLNKNVSMLKKAKGKAVIICVGTALKVLLKEGIYPDVIATLDGCIENYYHFQDLDYRKIPLVYFPIAYPEILNNHEGFKILTINSLPYLGETLFDLLKYVKYLDAGGSVAHLAFSFAREIGANPIVFVGQDLAYGEKMQTHAKGTSFDEGKILHKSKLYKENQLLIEDINGNEVLTDQVFYAFLRWFESEIENDITSTIYIDATEGGAKIKGTKIMTLKETIEEYMRNEIDIAKVSFGNESKQLIGDKVYVKKIITELKDIVNGLNILENEFDRGLDYIKKLRNAYEKDLYLDEEGKLTNELAQINSKFKSDIESFKVLSYVLNPTSLKLNEHDVDEYKLSIKEKKIKANIKQEYFYRNVKTAIEDVLPLIKECIDKLESEYITNEPEKYGGN
ncbi:MAG: DUF115 domain-containing protein [Maledivibacter sp.]|jgi:hypothetical protein|nr:DUF115 domain-containing protein [Maledivibacter sp.]